MSVSVSLNFQKSGLWTFPTKVSTFLFLYILLLFRHQRQIASCQLHICVWKNKDRILKKSKVFGLEWLGDMATIKRMPWLNMLIMCGRDARVVVLLCDCTDHMVDGKKKDAQYIMNYH